MSTKQHIVYICKLMAEIYENFHVTEIDWKLHSMPGAVTTAIMQDEATPKFYLFKIKTKQKNKNA